MTGNLFMWEYEGKTELGQEDEDLSHILWVKTIGGAATHYKTQVTNLTPIRVVPKDAVVIEGITVKELIYALDVATTHAKEVGCENSNADLIVKRLLDQLSSPPVKEPDLETPEAHAYSKGWNDGRDHEKTSPEPSKGVWLDCHPEVLRTFFEYCQLSDDERSPIVSYKFDDLKADLISQLTPVPKPLTEEQFNLDESVMARRRFKGLIGSVQYPPVIVKFFDHTKQENIIKVGFIEHSGHFCYLEETLYGNGGGGLELYSVSPDNYEKIDFYSIKAVQAHVEKLAGLVKGLGDEIYPSDVWPEPWDKNMKEVERLFPNLLARVYSDACRRAFRIAAKRIREIGEVEE